MTDVQTSVAKDNVMTLIETAPKLSPGFLHSEQGADLRVERNDISFYDVPGDKVRIEITVRNEGLRSSRPTSLRLESAPLGAFVPWRPLARLLVPALEPGESRVLSTQVARPRPVPLGDFNRVPPKRLLTAVNSPDAGSSQPSGGIRKLTDLLHRVKAAPSPRKAAPSPVQALAPDLLELVGRDQPHWAGNINVFVGRAAVERHRAKALRVYSGRKNLAMFIVGAPGMDDAYAFKLTGLSFEWEPALYDSTRLENLLINRTDSPIKETKWVEANGSRMMLLVIHPPENCKEGKLEVHVTRRSCGKTAIVEFDLDPDAQGTGCYFV